MTDPATSPALTPLPSGVTPAGSSPASRLRLSLVGRMLAALAVLLVGFLAPAAPASATVLGGTTYYTDGGVGCVAASRGLLTKPPTIAYYGTGLGGFATVYWQPVIYRYYAGSGWLPYKNTALWRYNDPNSQWFSAAANRYGVSAEGWRNSYTGRVLYPDFFVPNLPSGHYAVRSYLWKSSDGQTVTWWASKGGYCTFS
jgi:hypothetical protein